MRKRIAVVGAGAAGLMAGLDLRDAGHDVTVFEARERVGGRIHTVRFSDGRFANAGAEWLNSSDTVALSLTDRYRLDLVERSGFEALVDDGQPVLHDTGYPVLDEAFTAAVATLRDLEQPWNDPAARELDRLSLAEWAYRTGADPRTVSRFFQDNEGEYMAPATEISVAAAALSAALTNNDRAYRLRDGTASLPAAMAADLGDAVRLGQAVLEVEVKQDRASVSVRTIHETLTFDWVVLAVPLPALARVRVSPVLNLPWIGQGRGGKLMVSYDNADLERSSDRSPGTGMKFVYANAPHQVGGGTIMTAYSVQVLGPVEVLDTFARWFPDLTPSPSPPVAAWWSLDPYSGTTYSAPQPGYLDALRRLREPQPPVVLAGEHTEILFGYVESALVSGRRAARVIASAS